MDWKTWAFLAFIVLAGIVYWANDSRVEVEMNEVNAENLKTAVMAGGCFWCVESDLQKIPDVVSVISGYSGGTTENPTYENYAAGGHREVVEVSYDPTKVSYEDIVRHFLRHVDPTDPDGSFGDRGVEYSPAIYYETEEERGAAEKVLKEIEDKGIFDKSLVVPVLAREKFWVAEDYHQDYAAKNSLRYKLYRTASGRDRFIDKHWQE